MTIERCRKCDKMLFGLEKTHHICPPEFEVIEEDSFDGDNTDWEKTACKIYAYDHEDAAKECADELDSGSGEGASDRTFYVRDKKTLTIKKFSISHDYSVNYYAHEVEL